tara:strand:+ start:494 stop:760 length:267 start_codon:yes stop_codon:yes gene_type:complete
MDRVAVKKQLLMTPTSDLVNNALFKYQLFVYFRASLWDKTEYFKDTFLSIQNSIQLTGIDVFLDAKEFQETIEGRGKREEDGINIFIF